MTIAYINAIFLIKVSNGKKGIMAFIRTSKVKTSSSVVQEYVKIVESYRKDGRVKQRTIANLGNIEVLRKDIKQIINGLLRACGEKTITFAEDGRLIATKEYGVRYVAEEIWKRSEIGEIIKRHLKVRSASKRYEQWVLMMVVNKLSDPMSKLGIFRWLNGVYWFEHGFNNLLFSEDITEQEYLDVAASEVMKFYRGMDYLLSLKDEIEVHLYHKLKDLFSLKVDIVFYDLTSSYFEGRGPEGLAELGYSRDHEPGREQVVIGLIMCNGMPIGHEVFEGNRVDKKTVKEVIKKLKSRYEIGRCIFVGDRGLITKENLEEIETNGLESIFAMRKRRDKEVAEIVLGCSSRIWCIEDEELWWQEVRSADGIRYIVCRNPDVAVKQRQMREDNIKWLKEEIEKIKDKTERAKKKPSLKKVIAQIEEILRHKHGRRLISYEVEEKDRKISYWIKEKSLKIEEALDGIYILRTRETAMNARQIIEAYKDLTDVERAFRTMKSSLQLRPFYHRTESRVKAHVLICYLAFLIERYVERHLKIHKAGFSAATAFESLSQLGAATMEVDGQRYTYISEPSRRDKIIFKSLGIQSPTRCLIENKQPPFIKDGAF